MNTLKTALLMALLTVLLVLIGGAIGGRGGMFGKLLMAILAPIAAMLVQMAISRSREFGTNAATAHMFIVNPLTGGGVVSFFSTTPIPEQVHRLKDISRTHDY